MGKIIYLICGIAVLNFATIDLAAAQEKSLGFNAGYPLTVGDTFLSKYDGVAGGGLTYSHPVSSHLLLRPSVEYVRLTFDRNDVTANIYTLRVGLGYALQLTRSLKMVPEVGTGYARFSFQTPEDDVGSNSISTWIALNPRLSVNPTTEIGVLFGYKASFFEEPGVALNTPYNRQLHALMFGVTFTFGL